MNVVVTGSTSGIGLNIALGFLAKGHSVVVNGLCSDLEALKKILSPYQDRVWYSDANLMREEGVRELITFSLKKMSSIDVLINNAGKQFVSPVENFPSEEWQSILSLNLSAVFYAIKDVFPRMKEKGFGRIINIASVHGLVASEFKSAYVASKHGVLGLTKTIALEGAPFGITCNAICPGYVKTPLVEGQIKDQAKAHHLSEDEVVSKVLLAKHVVKDFVSMDAITEMCLFLTSENSGQISGSSFTLDGAWTAQ
jgi:3-hydroxybutyrate dehydrogenase